MKTHLPMILLGLIAGIISACSSNSEHKASAAIARPEVMVSSPIIGTITDSVALSSRVRFLHKNTVAAPFSGYIKEVMIKPGDSVQKGQTLFTLDSKESHVLSQANSAQRLGTVSITAPSNGKVANTFYSSGDYIQEGSVLAEIVKPEETYLEVYVPLQYRSFIRTNKSVIVELPDQSGNQRTAIIQNPMSSADSPSQTVVYLAKLKTSDILPEGLILTVWLRTYTHSKTFILPKEAVLANEEFTSFWVMKIVDESMVVKVPVTTGLTDGKKVEILSPRFEPSDKIVVAGQFGLEDSTIVRVHKK